MHQLLVGALRVGVDDDHVEVVAEGLLHLAGALDDLLQVVVVHRLGVLQLPPRNGKSNRIGTVLARI